jgi:hypothetical protein
MNQVGKYLTPGKHHICNNRTECTVCKQSGMNGSGLFAGSSQDMKALKSAVIDLRDEFLAGFEPERRDIYDKMILVYAKEAARKEAVAKEAVRKEVAFKEKAREQAIAKEGSARKETVRKKTVRKKIAQEEAARKEVAMKECDTVPSTDFIDGSVHEDLPCNWLQQKIKTEKVWVYGRPQLKGYSRQELMDRHFAACFNDSFYMCMVEDQMEEDLEAYNSTVEYYRYICNKQGSCGKRKYSDLMDLQDAKYQQYRMRSGRFEILDEWYFSLMS